MARDSKKGMPEAGAGAARRFFRAQELEKILDRVSRGSGTLILGAPRFGKTNLLRKLRSSVAHGGEECYSIDLTSITRESFASSGSVRDYIMDRILRVFANLGATQSADILHAQSPESWLDAIEKQMVRAVRLVYLVDDLDLVLDWPVDARRGLLATLSILARGRGEWGSVAVPVVTGGMRLWEEGLDEVAPFLEVPDLVLRPLEVGHFSQGGGIPGRVVGEQDYLRKSGGHPEVCDLLLSPSSGDDDAIVSGFLEDHARLAAGRVIPRGEGAKEVLRRLDSLGELSEEQIREVVNGEARFDLVFRTCLLSGLAAGDLLPRRLVRVDSPVWMLARLELGRADDVSLGGSAIGGDDLKAKDGELLFCAKTLCVAIKGKSPLSLRLGPFCLLYIMSLEGMSERYARKAWAEARITEIVDKVRKEAGTLHKNDEKAFRGGINARSILKTLVRNVQKHFGEELAEQWFRKGCGYIAVVAPLTPTMPGVDDPG